jgi:signal transduction histidine kinase
MLPSGSGLGGLSVAAAVGLPVALDIATHRRVGEPIAGQVAQSRQPLLVADRDAQSGHDGQYETGSFICVPIALADTCGVLSIADPIGQRAFGQDDLDRLRPLADYLAAQLPQIEAQQRGQRLEGVVNELRRQIVNTQEAERQRISRDIHDEVGHALIEAIFSLDQDASTLPRDDAAQAVIRAARQRLVDCATALHEIVIALRPRLLEERGLVAAVRYLLKQASRASGLDMDLVVAGDLGTLEGDM